MAAEAKHRRISRELLAEIAAGKYRPPERLPSEAELVERFRVSRPTAARALRDLVDQGLIERRVGSGTFLRSPASAGSDRAQRHLGLLIPGLGTTEIFEVICGELAGLARVHDYALLWGGGGQVPRPEATGVEAAEELCEQFIQRRVSGVFFAPLEHTEEKEEANRHLAERLRKAGIALVLLDRDLGPFPARSEFDLVGIDNFASGYLLAAHLLKLGCRRLAFVAPPFFAPTVSIRVAGAREAMLDRKLPLRPDFLRVGQPDDLGFVKGLATGRQVEAVICANDRSAAMLIRSLEKLGIRVPRGIRVVGFDDVKYATLLSVQLTTMHQPCREIAVTAFRAMLDRIAEPSLPPRSFVLTATLVVRESCGAYLPGRSR